MKNKRHEHQTTVDTSMINNEKNSHNEYIIKKNN